MTGLKGQRLHQLVDRSMCCVVSPATRGVLVEVAKVRRQSVAARTKNSQVPSLAVVGVSVNVIDLNRNSSGDRVDLRPPTLRASILCFLDQEALDGLRGAITVVAVPRTIQPCQDLLTLLFSAGTSIAPISVLDGLAAIGAQLSPIASMCGSAAVAPLRIPEAGSGAILPPPFAQRCSANCTRA